MCVRYSCESIVNSSDAFPEHPNRKRTRPTAKQPLGRSSLASVDDGSDSLQPCSLGSNSLLPPPCTSGVGRKSPGKQNILPVPPCSSQAFLGEPEDRTAHLLTAYKESALGSWGRTQCPATPMPGSRMMTRRAELSPSSARVSQWGLSWERKGREAARCATTSSFYPPRYLYPVSVSLLLHVRIYEPVHAFLMKFWGQHIWLVTHFCKSPDKTTLKKH